MRCTHCGAEVSSDSRFCTSCGTAVESAPMPTNGQAPDQSPEPARCPACGAATEAGTRFCTVCGAMLEPVATEPTPLSDDPIDNIGTQPIGAVPAARTSLDRTVAAPRIAAEPAAASSAVADAASNVPAAAPQPSKQPVPSALWVLLGVVIAVLIAGGVYLALTLFSAGEAKEANNGAGATVATQSNGDEDGNENADEPQADTGNSSHTSSSAVNTATDAIAQDGYILPESSQRVYAESELEGMSARDLYIARNEIYARHGRSFQNDDLREHFSQLSWYTPTYTPENFDANVTLSDIELANIDVIVKVEQEMGSPWAVE